MTNKLYEYLTNCARCYYMGEPLISDEVFDRLADSISFSEVGSKQHENIEKHYYQMYSLQKYYEDSGKAPDIGGEASISPKLDGAAISILYVNGKLVRVLTRGDGIEGTLVTDKFLATNLIPHEINNDGIIQITGELVAPKTVENSRNYAAGSLNLKDINEFRTRAVTFFAYGVQPNLSSTYDNDMLYLKQFGFNTIKESDIDKIYPSDGIVFRVNDNETFNSMGYTAKHPRGAYALKERGEAVETELLDVIWQVGRGGRVSPVAILKPVYIGDKLVSRATLNNIGFIRALDLHIGDTVGVILGGEIIPTLTHKIE